MLTLWQSELGKIIPFCYLIAFEFAHTYNII